MKRREFLAGAAMAGMFGPRLFAAEQEAAAPQNGACCGPMYATVQDAILSPRETLLYCAALYVRTGRDQPDYLATIDVDPSSPAYCQVVHRTPMPNVGDELHHFGWNACSSCHAQPDAYRRYLIVPGFKSGRIHVLDAAEPNRPTLYKVIEPEEIAARVNLSAPHTVHCLADGKIMISMLGDAQGNSPGGFMLLTQEFAIAGRWEPEGAAPQYNYDYWYQPRHNIMVSSEWAAPNTFDAGFDPEQVKAGKYGRSLNFWDWSQRKLLKRVDLGEEGLIPLEVRFHHNPASTHGYVGAALSSALWHWHQDDAGEWQVAKVAQVESVEAEGWPFPVPGLITDLLLSLDDRWLYCSNWLHGDIRQYDISNPAQPKLTAQAWLGGVLGKGQEFRGRKLAGGPQMLQLSRDGRRLYVTNSLYSSWDNQFYPQIAEEGSYLLQLDCNTEQGGLTVNDKFYVDFGKEPGGPARAHEMRFPDGDCTSDIWV